MKDSKLICGIGINDKSRPAWIGDNQYKTIYHLENMIKRCYDKNVLLGDQIILAVLFLITSSITSYFYDWASEQIGFVF